MRKVYLFLLILVASVFAGSSAFAQSSFLDLTIVESSNYNKPLANFSYSNFDNTFVVSSTKGTTTEPNINRALLYFLKQLAPQKSYVIQHEPTYYFVFQYREKDDNYIVLNNTIGEKNEAIYCATFKEAQGQMLLLLQNFYNNIPIVSIQERK
jgi:hypothetical protein